MRDPELVFKAQLAASALERAWQRWRTTHGLVADPMPAISSYVGYSLEEPWGQPRVVFGLSAKDAEQLAALLNRHDCIGPVHAGIAGRPMAEQHGSEVAAAAAGRPLAVPPQTPSIVAEQSSTGDPRSLGMVQGKPRWPSSTDPDLDGPVYRQLARAAQEAGRQAAAGRQATPVGLASHGLAAAGQAGTPAAQPHAGSALTSRPYAAQAGTAQAEHGLAGRGQAGVAEAETAPLGTVPADTVQADTSVQAGTVQADTKVRADAKVPADTVRADTVRGDTVRGDSARPDAVQVATEAGSAGQAAGERAAVAEVRSGGATAAPITPDRRASAHASADTATTVEAPATQTTHAQPAPKQPAPEQPAPEQPAPEQPAPEQSALIRAEAPAVPGSAPPETTAAPERQDTGPAADARSAPTSKAAIVVPKQRHEHGQGSQSEAHGKAGADLKHATAKDATAKEANAKDATAKDATEKDKARDGKGGDGDGDGTDPGGGGGSRGPAPAMPAGRNRARTRAGESRASFVSHQGTAGDTRPATKGSGVRVGEPVQAVPQATPYPDPPAEEGSTIESGITSAVSADAQAEDYPGPLALAASAARVAAEARIKAAMQRTSPAATQDRHVSLERAYPKASAAAVQAVAAGPDVASGALPRISDEPLEFGYEDEDDADVAFAWGGPAFAARPGGRPEVVPLRPRQDDADYDDEDLDLAADERSEHSPSGYVRRNRITRGYSIPRLSRAKRPGAVPGL